MWLLGNKLGQTTWILLRAPMFSFSYLYPSRARDKKVILLLKRDKKYCGCDCFPGDTEKGNNKSFRWWKNKQKVKRKVLWNSRRGGMVQRNIRRGGVGGRKELVVCMGRKSVIQMHVQMLSPYCWIKSVFCEGYLPCCRIGSNKSWFKCKKYLIITLFCLAWTAWHLTGSQQCLEGFVRDCITNQ